MRFIQQRTEIAEPIDMESDSGLIVLVECEEPVGNFRLQLDLTPRHSVHDIYEKRAKQSKLGPSPPDTSAWRRHCQTTRLAVRRDCNRAASSPGGRGLEPAVV